MDNSAQNPLSPSSQPVPQAPSQRETFPQEPMGQPVSPPQPMQEPFSSPPSQPGPVQPVVGTDSTVQPAAMPAPAWAPTPIMPAASSAPANETLAQAPVQMPAAPPTTPEVSAVMPPSFSSQPQTENAPLTATGAKGGTKLPVIIGVIFIALLVGGILAYRTIQPATAPLAPRPQVAKQPLVTPTPDAAALAAKEKADTSDTQLEKDAQAADNELKILDNDVASADKGLNDQAVNLN